DNFTSTTNQIKFGAKNSIDPENNELRPSSYTTELDLILGSTASTGVNGVLDPNSDIRFAEDLIAENIRRSTVDPNGSAGTDGMGVITLDYEEVTAEEQLTATRVVNAAPYFVDFYTGQVTLNPSSDIWVEQSRIETQTIEGLIGGVTQTNIRATPADLDPQAGWSPTLWGGWNRNWTGRTVTRRTLTGSDSETLRGGRGTRPGRATARASVTTQ
ncbi:MAG: hypothetical protein VW454_07215, partial [Pelagibacteraceae bacterium]